LQSSPAVANLVSVGLKEMPLTLVLSCEKTEWSGAMLGDQYLRRSG
jgi:hypothetical protein